MRRLGYTRYVAQGGDVGAAVTDTMGRQAPAGLLGIHMNLLVTVLAGPPQAESEQERAAVAQLATFRESGFGYLLEMATRPQTIGYALLDSPGRPGRLAARPRHGQLLQDLPRVRRRQSRGQSRPGPDRRQRHPVLADGHRRLGGPVLLGGRSGPGTGTRVRPGPSAGVAPGRLHHLPRRDLADPRSWVENSYPNVSYFHEADRGGHFAAWEEPELFATEIRAAFASLR
jgi:pimeloyl-ACP methyl ester carboxylesterase